ncbi:MAG: heat-inducible transcriptional repressor HrcA [Bacillota bacterium]
MQLDERKRRVMRAIVEAYVLNAQPVGSRTIARDYDLGVSPATIRNEMSDLEGMGYLEQPYTSAGRVPSDLGYRFYVDQLVMVSTPASEQLEQIRRLLEHRVSAVEAVLQTAGRILAEVTDCLAVVAAPYPEESTLNAVEIISLRPGRAMLLVITEEGCVHNQILDLPDEIGDDALRHASQVITRFLHGERLRDIVDGPIWWELRSELNYCRRLLDVAAEALTSRDRSQVDFHLEGAVNIMKQPEFQDVRRAQKVLTALSRHSVMRDMFSPFPAEGVFALIGRENVYEDIWDCSVVSAVYHIDGRPSGRLGVLGPRRMDYGKIMGVVKAITEAVSDVLSHL